MQKAQLIIFLPATENASCKWGILTPGETHFSAQGELAVAQLDELSAHGVAAQNVIAVMPGTDVRLTEVQLPSRQTRQAMKAVPFLLEDQVASPIEDLHFALGEREGTRLQVVVTAKQRIQQWCALLQQAGLKLAALIPDIFLLPAHTDTWVACALHDRVLLRHDRYHAYAADHHNVAELLSLATVVYKQQHEGAGEPVLHVYGQTHELAHVAQSLALPYELQEESDPWLWLAKQAQSIPFNLLQGDFGARNDYRALWQTFRPAAYALLTWFGVALAYHSLVWIQAARADNKVQAQIKEIFQSVSPDQTRIVNPKAQLRSQLDALKQHQGDQGFLFLLQHISQQLQAGQDVQITALSFEQARAELRVDINAKDLTVVENFKQQLLQQGLEVELNSASAQGERYQGRIVLRRKS